ncbi:MAG: hypothetical protein V1811_03045 [Candidatus Micrarchaeota archaeon]
MKKIFFALAILSVLFTGCLQEKTLDASSINEPIATAETNWEPTVTPTSIPSGSGTATPAATTTPTPTQTQAAPNCTIVANPEAVTGPGDIVLVIAFNKLPSDSNANIDCGSPGQSGSTSVRANPNGAISAFKRCTYPDVSSNTVFTARVTATGGFSCSKEVTVRG